MREIVLDTETTGLDPDGGDRIIELACVELIDQLPTGAVYHQLINPERDVPAEAVAVHGITNERLAAEPLFAAVVEAFLEFIGESPLVIHNAVFDMRFINCEFGLCGRPEIPSAARTTRWRSRGRSSLEPRPASMRCASASRSISPNARSTTPWSTPSCWRGSIWNWWAGRSGAST